MGYNYKKKNPVRIGRVNLSNPAELKRVTKLSVNLQLQTEALIKKTCVHGEMPGNMPRTWNIPTGYRYTMCTVMWMWICILQVVWDNVAGMC